MVTSKCYLIYSTQDKNYGDAVSACATANVPTGPATGGYLGDGI
jgi:hypothetical protein